MPITNEIVLRPRFKKELNHDHATVLKVFEETKTTNKTFKIVRVDDHIFIRLPTHKQHFWSPQLHLEINEVDQNTSMLHGLFGPNPTVWTMFMFLHFLVAGLFIAFGIWTYTNWTLSNPYGIQLGMMLLMVVIWVVLYVAGRFGRAKGKAEMHELYDFMNTTLSNNGLV
ncbi:GTP-binding protein [Gelidibacter salicanalis]|uniref:GTP-binding protein n=1 Tax=Gelidibacter salicanalis TaxID=291193 RepID=A0A934NE54_9FLAO|nr:GTP-binding protein [Gelidibacter salicanalis]MBJ7882360.1 GTP-binding protein [Gelidibacter salicanalis]